MIVVSSKSKKQKSSGLKTEYFSTIVLHHTVLEMLNDEMTRILGAKEAARLNYKQGKKVGKALVKQFKGSLKVGEMKPLMKYFMEIGKLSGLIYEIHSYKWVKNKFIARGKTSISNKKNKTNNPTCQYLAGEIEGVAETLTGKEWKCVETKCVSKGDKYDEFVLSLKGK